MLLEMKVSGLAIDPFTNVPIVILKDADEKNVLPVWIGVLEASAIASELEKIQFSRPMTHDLMKEILKNVNVKVKKVEVNDLKDNIYYATMYMTTGAGDFTIDARPSDAIAMALRTSSPIFVDSKVLDKSRNIDFSGAADKKKKGKGTKGLAELLEELSPGDFGKYKM